MRIGFDLDGVLACFYAGYERLTIAHSGEDKFGAHKWPQEWPCTWNWPEHWGYSKELMDFRNGPVWSEIKTSDTFWLTLPPMPEIATFQKFMAATAGEHQVYFVTDRPGPTAKLQSELWLMRYGVSCPTVIISRKGKGIVCEALDLELYLDDKGENIVDVDERSPNTRGVLLERPYNQHVTVKHRAETIADVLAELTQEVAA